MTGLMADKFHMKNNIRHNRQLKKENNLSQTQRSTGNNGVDLGTIVLSFEKTSSFLNANAWGWPIQVQR
jgi:hypothetical protein